MLGSATLIVIFCYAFVPRVKLVKSGTVVIAYDTKKGFIPREIVVAKGTTVRFENVSGTAFWPASDFYPQNSNYPDFDPKGAVENGKGWEFRFDTPGEWAYHDHLRPIDKGLVTVVNGGRIYFEKKSTCGDMDKLSYSQKQLCWYNQIKSSVKSGGVSKALSLFKDLYNKESSFSQGCHDAMHLIGDEAYREHLKGNKFDFTVETTYCGYGFYHGFIEAMLYTKGDYEEVTKFCEDTKTNLKTDIESPNAIYSCYHGIGHSTFDAHDPSSWGSEEKMVTPAIKTCERITSGFSEEKTKQCITGVFNALGIAYSSGLYKFKLNMKDPVWYCRPLKENYKKACFIEVSMAYVNSQLGGYDFKFSEGANFIAGLKDPVGEEAAMFALSSEFSRLHLSDFTNSRLLGNCETVKSGLFDSCLQGVELALLNWGKPGEEYKRALLLCSDQKLNSKNKEKCLTYIFNNLPSLYSKNKRTEICQNEVEENFRESCININ